MVSSDDLQPEAVVQSVFAIIALVVLEDPLRQWPHGCGEIRDSGRRERIRSLTRERS